MRYHSRFDSYNRWLGTDYPMVKLLISINVVVYFIQYILIFFGLGRWVSMHLALSPYIWDGEIWQLVTYMFLHSANDPFHILFNMLALWMFGKELEMVWGSREFVKYYFICGVGAGLTFLFFSNGIVVGASGAVFGILLAFGMTFPDQIIMMSFLFPIKAKYMVMIYGVITFMNIANPSGDNIAHLAHLGGMVFGFLYLKKEWFKRKMQETPKPRTAERPPVTPPVMTVQSRPKPPEPKQVIRDRVDEILDKINEVGYDKLTAEEKEILLRASQNYAEQKKP
ncbi:rhomboid family intramembrane serine protease [bacterium]|nr:rhomboid family intramembrane serine protease [bacterium]NUN46659.1 rhomboid family intramembrane serine protease [bacterium]